MQRYEYADDACPWLDDEPEGIFGDDLLRCWDGSSCDPAVAGWHCCTCHGGRAYCPSKTPYFCDDMSCGSGTAWCCKAKCSPGAEGHTRPCPIPRTCQPSGNAVGHLMCHPYRPSRPSRRFFRARLITRRRPRRRPRPRALRPRPPNPRPCRLSPMRRRQRGPLWPPSCWEAPQFLSSSYFSHYSP